MSERLFGMETEYGLSVVQRKETEYNPECLPEILMGLARKHPHLPGYRSKGIFLPNGSRFYVDCGTHPEFCTPECTNPWDVCRYVRAGEQWLLDLAGQLKQCDGDIEHALVLRSNVDYTSRATWGTHESYLHNNVDQDTLSREIIPHLVTRQVFSGAGGFDCHSPGIAFRVSPRVSHLVSTISSESTGGRGIFHTRDEPLCGKGYRRLHILCGESLCGETGTWLKIGTTALVVALIEAGKMPAYGMELQDPLDAMRAFSADPACKRSVKLAGGREATALDIQYHYLRQAEAHVEASFMPPWAHEVCRNWRAVLDRLRAGAPGSVARTLDWAVKFSLFQSHVRKRGASFENIADWTHVLEQMTHPLGFADLCDKPPALNAEFVLSARGPLAAARKRVTPLLRERGLDWDGLAGFLALRLELFEIDTRYSLLNEDGIFTLLERGGVLDHHFPGVDNIPHALENPPASGRAALRGACISRFAGRKKRYACEWDGIVDLTAGRRLNLADPFCQSEEWETNAAEPETRRPDLEGLFRVGRYAEVLARTALPVRTGLSDVETVALSYARVGRQSEALNLLQTYLPVLGEFHHLALRMSVFSNGLVPDVEQLEALVAGGDPMLARNTSENSYTSFVFLLYKALFLLHKRHYALAGALFTSLLDDACNAFRTRMFARTRCYFAELNRRLGRHEAALELVEAAARDYHRERLTGDLADHSLPMLAKLTPDDTEAGRLLGEAAATQRAFCNKLGLARILCIRARRLRFADDRQEIELLQRTVPVLRNCEAARSIVSNWSSWISPEVTAEPLDYWGL